MSKKDEIKRKFKLIISNKKCGNYTSASLESVKKRIVLKKCKKNHEIIFYLEDIKLAKKYGPYIGYIKNDKPVVKKHKMHGGVLDPAEINKINNLNFKNAFIELHNTLQLPPQQSIMTIPLNFRFVTISFRANIEGIFNPRFSQTLLIFGDTIQCNGINYLTYVCYLEYGTNNLIFKQIRCIQSEINITNISEYVLFAINILDLRTFMSKTSRQSYNPSSNITEVKNIKNIKSILRVLYDELTRISLSENQKLFKEKLLELLNKLSRNNTQLFQMTNQNTQINKQAKCVFNNIGISNFLASSTNPSSIKRSKFCVSSRTILFFNDNLFSDTKKFIKALNNFSNSSYYTNVIYGEFNNIFFLKLVVENGRLKIQIDDIKNISIDTLSKILNYINTIRSRGEPKFAEKIIIKISSFLRDNGLWSDSQKRKHNLQKNEFNKQINIRRSIQSNINNNTLTRWKNTQKLQFFGRSEAKIY